MSAGERRPGQTLECHWCHRIGTRAFSPWGSEGWECSNDRACSERSRRRDRATLLELTNQTGCVVRAVLYGETETTLTRGDTGKWFSAEAARGRYWHASRDIRLVEVLSKPYAYTGPEGEGR